MNNLRLKLIILQIILACFQIHSQVSQEWAQRYAGALDSSDYGVAINNDANGNIYVLASSQGSMTRTDFAVLKYNSSGVQQWVQRYNSPANSYDVPVKMLLDAAGNIYVTGYSNISGFLNNDITTIKYNNSGVQQWVKTYSGTASADDRPAGIAADNSGNVYVTGYTTSTGSGEDFVTIKYNSSGTEEWVKKFNGTANGIDKATGITTDNNGNICVTGYGQGTGTGYDMVTIKYSPTGAEIWVKKLTGTGSNSEFARAIGSDAYGNIYIAGSGTVGSNRDYFTIKYNSSGDTLWTRKYDGPDVSTDEAYYIVVFDTNNIYVSGLSYGSSTGEDIATVKYNSQGVQQWAVRYDGPGGDGSSGPRGLQEDFVNAMATDNSGNLYITGTAYYTTGLHDYVTIKYDPAGVQKWIQTYNGQSNDDDGANSICIDNSGNIYVTGYSAHSSANNDDCITIKYSQTIGISNISGEIPASYSLSQNYPNPFNPTTHFGFRIVDFGLVRLSVYDALGKEVTILVNQQLQPGTYEVSWDAAAFSSGIYFYRIESSQFSQTRKMILIK